MNLKELVTEEEYKDFLELVKEAKEYVENMMDINDNEENIKAYLYNFSLIQIIKLKKEIRQLKAGEK